MHLRGGVLPDVLMDFFSSDDTVFLGTSWTSDSLRWSIPMTSPERRAFPYSAIIANNEVSRRMQRTEP